jgi:hypothetical protein
MPRQEIEQASEGMVVTVAEFTAADSREFSGVLLALWWDGRGDWQKAHEIAQEVPGAEGAWVHAYLHRKEGDAGNAAYWYHRAGRPIRQGDLGGEWEEIVRELLAR